MPEEWQQIRQSHSALAAQWRNRRLSQPDTPLPKAKEVQLAQILCVRNVTVIVLASPPSPTHAAKQEFGFALPLSFFTHSNLIAAQHDSRPTVPEVARLVPGCVFARCHTNLSGWS